jgi:transposase
MQSFVGRDSVESIPFRFAFCANDVGLIPSEDSSGQRRRLGAIAKQGSSFLRFLLVQAAASAVKGGGGREQKKQKRCSQGGSFAIRRCR